MDGRETVTKIQLIKRKKAKLRTVYTLCSHFVDKCEEGQVLYIVPFSLVQSLSCVRLFVTL